MRGERDGWTRLHFVRYTLTVELRPEAPFGVPQDGTIVFPAATAEFISLCAPAISCCVERRRTGA